MKKEKIRAMMDVMIKSLNDRDARDKARRETLKKRRLEEKKSDTGYE